MSENRTNIIIALILPKRSKIDHLSFLAPIARELTVANFNKQLQMATEKNGHYNAFNQHYQKRSNWIRSSK